MRAPSRPVCRKQANRLVSARAGEPSYEESGSGPDEPVHLRKSGNELISALAPRAKGPRAPRGRRACRSEPRCPCSRPRRLMARRQPSSPSRRAYGSSVRSRTEHLLAMSPWGSRGSGVHRQSRRDRRAPRRPLLDTPATRRDTKTVSHTLSSNLRGVDDHQCRRFVVSSPQRQDGDFD